MKRRERGPRKQTPDKKFDSTGAHQEGADASAAEEAASRVQRRRTALKTISGGSVLAASGMLPDKWTRPVIQSVLLPAHAQMSPATPPPGCEGCTGVTIDSSSATETSADVANVSASGTLSSPDDCLVGEPLTVVLQGWTGNNCNAQGGQSEQGSRTFTVTIQAGGSWSFTDEQLDASGISGNMQSVDITVGYPTATSEGCTATACADTTASGGN